MFNSPAIKNGFLLQRFSTKTFYEVVLMKVFLSKQGFKMILNPMKTFLHHEDTYWCILLKIYSWKTLKKTLCIPDTPFTRVHTQPWCVCGFFYRDYKHRTGFPINLPKHDTRCYSCLFESRVDDKQILSVFKKPHMQPPNDTASILQ